MLNSEKQDQKTTDASIAQNRLLCAVTCPECGGSGIVYNVDYVAGCCRCPNEDGSCCNVPIPEPVQVQEQCSNCQATGVVQA